MRAIPPGNARRHDLSVGLDRQPERLGVPYTEGGGRLTVSTERAVEVAWLCPGGSCGDCKQNERHYDQAKKETYQSLHHARLGTDLQRKLRRYGSPRNTYLFVVMGGAIVASNANGGCGSVQLLFYEGAAYPGGGTLAHDGEADRGGAGGRSSPDALPGRAEEKSPRNWGSGSVRYGSCDEQPNNSQPADCEHDHRYVAYQSFGLLTKRAMPM